MDPLLKCLLDLCWHVAFLFYQVSTWNWTLLLVIYNVDTLCRDKQEGILRNELNAFLFFSEKPNFWPTQGNVLKISYRGKPCPGSHIFDDIHQNTGKSSARIQVRDPCLPTPRKNAGFIRWNIPPSPAAVWVNLVSQSLLFIWKLYIFLCQ